MRPTILTAIPILAALAVAPLPAQVSARLHADIPIGRSAAVAVAPRRAIVVRDYAPIRYGVWQRYYPLWQPTTLYFYGGQYFDYPITTARPVVGYRYRSEVFLPPRDREWVRLHGDVRARPRP